MLQKAPKNNCKKKNVVSKKYLSLQRFNKHIDCFTELKSKENEEISFNVRGYRSYLFRILW